MAERYASKETSDSAPDDEFEILLKSHYSRALIGGLLMCLAGFLLWSVICPLDSGARAKGVIAPEGMVHRVEHLEGGIVREIYARDGNWVAKGQPLLGLDTARSDSELKSVRNRLFSLMGRQARLEALLAESSTLDKEIHERLDAGSEGAKVIAREQAILSDELAAIRSTQRLFAQQEEQLRTQLSSLHAINQSIENRCSLIAEDLTSYRVLLEKGLVKRTVVREIERRFAEVDAEFEQNLISIQTVQAGLRQLETRRVSQQEERMAQTGRELSETVSEIESLSSQAAALRDVSDRRSLLAPADGHVVELIDVTEGRVVRPGEAIFDIVPDKTPLLVEAHIAPKDIANVSIGQEVLLVVTAFRQRNAPRLKGELISISADTVTDPQTQLPVYKASISVPPGELMALGNKGTLRSGMEVDVTIRSGRRTFAWMMLEPVFGSMDEAFTAGG